LRNSGGALPQHIATGVVTLIERLSPGDGLCHGDLHPGNVIMTPDGPKIVDWQGCDPCAARSVRPHAIARTACPMD
jgi:aminoglycoside phosphotransferase (APT) family kinase protein